MAEDEIRKHAKKALTIMQNHQDDWKHKLKDITIEVLIIVFAVSISIWFHNLSDRSQEHKEEKQFLEGFRNDLKDDIDNIKSSREFYVHTLRGMQYFSKVGSGDSLKKDSMIKYGSIFFSSTDLEPHNSRYEALKSSGKLGIIENKELLNKIINLNESTLPHIQILNNIYLKQTDKISAFLQQNGKLDKPGNLTKRV